MPIPVLFTARNGIVWFRMRPVPDWVVQETRRAIRDEGLEARVETFAFTVWLEAYEQLRDAVVHANNQRRIGDKAQGHGQ